HCQSAGSLCSLRSLWLNPSLNHIAVAAAGLHKIFAQFFADITDMNVEQIGKRFVFFCEQMVIKIGPADNRAALKSEELNERIFPRRQGDFFCMHLYHP